jgi:hypothetical protein
MGIQHRITILKGRIENPFANRAGKAIPLNDVDGCLCVYPKEQNKFHENKNNKCDISFINFAKYVV